MEMATAISGSRGASFAADVSNDGGPLGCEWGKTTSTFGHFEWEVMSYTPLTLLYTAGLFAGLRSADDGCDFDVDGCGDSVFATCRLDVDALWLLPDDVDGTTAATDPGFALTVTADFLPGVIMPRASAKLVPIELSISCTVFDFFFSCDPAPSLRSLRSFDVPTPPPLLLLESSALRLPLEAAAAADDVDDDAAILSAAGE